jgi:hypothetical protein
MCPRRAFGGNRESLLDISESRDQEAQRALERREADLEWEGLHGFYMGSGPAVQPPKKSAGIILRAVRAVVKWCRDGN